MANTANIIELDPLATKLVDCAFQVHKALGPGLLESYYEQAMGIEMESRGIKFQRQPVVPVFYKNILLDGQFRLDFLVENKIVLELKSVEVMNPVYQAQILTYMKISKAKLGLLINFNVPLIKNGIKRFVL
jgi:GxxExxY protein